MRETLLLIIGPLAASFATWLFAKRKMAADAISNELDNTAKIVRMWRELSEGMEKRFKEEIDQLRKDNCDLQKKIEQVMEENETLREQMNDLERENKKLQDQLKIFNKNNQKQKAKQ
jgi:septal ring factor EnvC (AmiA/AmiB activator)